MNWIYSIDERLFLWLNFDGGAFLDTAMEIVSGTAMWIPLYGFILYAVWRRYGWKSALAFVVCLALAMGIADMLCGIFKHTGPLKNLWESFPGRQRPMFNISVKALALDLGDVVHIPSTKHGLYGTVSAHAATVAALALMSAAAIGKKWYTATIVAATLLICYSRIYKACHFPLDILLGLAVGLISGWLMYLLWKKLAKTIQKLSK